MMKKLIYRKPCGKQDRFYISTVYTRTKNVRRSLELCKDMRLNMVNFNRVNEKDAYACATACEEVAINGSFLNKEIVNLFDFAVDKKAVTNPYKCKSISMKEEGLSPEKLRMSVYGAILRGVIGIEYNNVFGLGITKDGKQGPLFRYIQDMNYRIMQIGRTLMALKNVGVYCSEDVKERNPELAMVAKPISESAILADQELPEGVAIGEFVDTKGNRYLMYQNADYENKSTKSFNFKLKKNFRVYRVNPHDGKQMLSKESVDAQKILIMSGDADLLRYQDTEEEACLIEYALKK